MRFMSIVLSSQAPVQPPASLMEAMGKLADREIKAGRMIDMGGLMPIQTGMQVRIKDGQLKVIDGPFAETKEALGGYYLIEAADLDAAIAFAKEIPVVSGGLEVRPIMVFDR